MEFVWGPLIVRDYGLIYGIYISLGPITVPVGFGLTIVSGMMRWNIWFVIWFITFRCLRHILSLHWFHRVDGMYWYFPQRLLTILDLGVCNGCNDYRLCTWIFPDVWSSPADGP